jgi:glucokinase
MNRFFCGVDLGGTKLSVGLVDERGNVLDKLVVHDHVDKPENMVVEQVVLLIQKIIKKNQLTEDNLPGIGIGFPGHLRFRDGVTITTSNLKGFKDYPLRDEVQKHFNIPVVVDNDANAQAYGEFIYGAGIGYNTLIFMTISTGIGAGIVINRKVYRGLTGTAGEIGHTIVDATSKRRCTCGNYGCLMTCACGLALPHLFREKYEKGVKTFLKIPAGFNYASVDGHFIRKGMEMDDPLSNEIILECADYIGIALYNIFQVFNPPIIVLGGGLLSWGERYFQRIRKKFDELAGDMLFDPVNIVESKIGNDAGLIGAASLAAE